NPRIICAKCCLQRLADNESWICSCGTTNTGKFCSNCGQPKPANHGSWTCSCGTVNTGKFCSGCGKQHV
ncbi:MAG: hypothetical protein K2P03_03485, partial [Lachnospiraceae bacterium]|nr:hypothetical protein [Lachnospiraceae bacterium]